MKQTKYVPLVVVPALSFVWFIQEPVYPRKIMQVLILYLGYSKIMITFLRKSLFWDCRDKENTVHTFCNHFFRLITTQLWRDAVSLRTKPTSPKSPITTSKYKKLFFPDFRNVGSYARVFNVTHGKHNISRLKRPTIKMRPCEDLKKAQALKIFKNRIIKLNWVSLLAVAVKAVLLQHRSTINEDIITFLLTYQFCVSWSK